MPHARHRRRLAEGALAGRFLPHSRLPLPPLTLLCGGASGTTPSNCERVRLGLRGLGAPIRGLHAPSRRREPRFATIASAQAFAISWDRACANESRLADPGLEDNSDGCLRRLSFCGTKRKRQPRRRRRGMTRGQGGIPFAMRHALRVASYAAAHLDTTHCAFDLCASFL